MNIKDWFRKIDGTKVVGAALVAIITALAGFLFGRLLKDQEIEANQSAYAAERVDAYITRVQLAYENFYVSWQACKDGVEQAKPADRRSVHEKCLREVNKFIPALELLGGEYAGTKALDAVAPLRVFEPTKWAAGGRKEMRVVIDMATCAIRAKDQGALSSCLEKPPPETPRTSAASSAGSASPSKVTSTPPVAPTISVACAEINAKVPRGRQVVLRFDLTVSRAVRVGIGAGIYDDNGDHSEGRGDNPDFHATRGTSHNTRTVYVPADLKRGTYELTIEIWPQGQIGSRGEALADASCGTVQVL